MTNRHGTCPIWGMDCALSQVNGGEIWLVKNSFRAGGDYEITTEARLIIEELQDAEKARITSVLVEQWMKGVAIPRLTADDVRRTKDDKLLPVHERADRLLGLLARSSSRIGTELRLMGGEELGGKVLAWSESTFWEELQFLMDYLFRKGWVRRSTIIDFSGALNVKVEIPGFGRVEELEANPDSSQCFVAMWFDDSLNEVYEKGIRPAIEEDTGYSALRIDRQEFLGKIDDEIIAQLRRSRFLVADATHGDGGARGGVYYEAGFAQGLGLPVIFTCRNDMIDKVHLDTRQFNHIVWENPDDLREQLANRIGSVLGDGPKAKR